MIEKIIHQTGPTHKSDWHFIWEKCQQSWIDNFPDFEYKFWNDEEIEALVKDHYPEYWDMYSSFPVHIMQIDFARFCMLHKYGGIYADLDYFCYQNFYNDLTDGVYVVENPLGNDPIENSLMVSSAGNDFWIKCMDEVKHRFYYTMENHPELLSFINDISKNPEDCFIKRPMIIFNISGTQLLSSITRNEIYDGNKDIKTLSGYLYNNYEISYDPAFKAKHVHTGLWGKENIEALKDERNRYTDYYRYNINGEDYKFDLFKDYTNGKYKELEPVDLDKNDTRNNLSENFSYD